MKTLIITLGLIVSLGAFAGKGHKHHHHAHEHGAAELSLAFDGLTGKITFKAAAEGVLGFEHAPKSEKHKAKYAESVALFENSVAKMVQMDSSLGCIFKKEKIEQVMDGSHSDFVAEWAVTCQKSVEGSKINFDFTSVKGLKEIDVTVLAGAVQKSVEIKRKPVTVDLK